MGECLIKLSKNITDVEKQVERLKNRKEEREKREKKMKEEREKKMKKERETKLLISAEKSVTKLEQMLINVENEVKRLKKKKGKRERNFLTLAELREVKEKHAHKKKICC